MTVVAHPSTVQAQYLQAEEDLVIFGGGARPK